MYEYNAQPDVKYHSSPTRSSERTFEQQQFPFKWKLKSRKLLLQSVSRTTSDFLRPSTSHADLSDSAAGRKSFYRLNISRFRETRQSSRLTETLASQPARYRLVAWEGQSERRIWRGDWPTSCCNSLETIILRVLLTSSLLAGLLRSAGRNHLITAEATARDTRSTSPGMDENPEVSEIQRLDL